jgi:hypothetical protein
MAEGLKENQRIASETIKKMTMAPQMWKRINARVVERSINPITQAT